jgi:hypothetical protein
VLLTVVALILLNYFLEHHYFILPPSHLLSNEIHVEEGERIGSREELKHTAALKPVSIPV